MSCRGVGCAGLAVGARRWTIRHGSQAHAQREPGVAPPGRATGGGDRTNTDGSATVHAGDTGQSASHTFNRRGTYTFDCQTHPIMHGTMAHAAPPLRPVKRCPRELVGDQIATSISEDAVGFCGQTVTRTG